MIRLVFALCFALSAFAQGPRALAPGEAVRELPPRQKRWAVLIGVDTYANRQITTLFGAANDARGMKKVLVETAGFPAEQVYVLATGEPEEYQPTRANILATISNALQMVPADGLLWVQFSGHGVERGGRAFLLPQDARLSDDVGLLEDTSLSVARLRGRIQEKGVAQVVILLDACRNEPGGRADLKNPLSQSYVDGLRFEVRNQGVRAFATIYATAVGERAWEDTMLKRGYFSSMTEEGLRGAAANGRGEVTLQGLVQYLQREVPQRVRIRAGAEKRQLPFSRIEGFRAEELVLAVSAAAVVNPALDAAALAWGEVKDSSSCNVLKAFVAEFGGSAYGGVGRVRMARVCEGAVDAAKVAAEFAEGRRLYEIGQYFSAFALFRRLEDSGHYPSQAMRGFMLAWGLGTNANREEGKRVVEAALSRGSAEALWAKAQMLEEGVGFFKDEAESVRLLREAALAQDAFAMVDLGVRYEKGKGVNSDFDASTSWYRKAAERGSIHGQCNLGYNLERGLGAPKDEAAAVRLYRRAAEAGLPRAMFNLGLNFANGIGVGKDEQAAAVWYRKAADAGHAGAMNNLGRLFENGWGVSRSLSEAVVWFRKAAENGSAWGMANLSKKLRAGEGVAKDVAEADRWMAKAKAAGYKE